MKRIVCCVDFSDNARTAFEAAVEMAGKFSSKLYVIHVLPAVVNPMVLEDGGGLIPEEPKKSLILKIEERLHEEFGSRVPAGLDAEMCVLDGHVSTEIITFCKEKDADLVMTGSYGESGMGLVLFGSVAKRVARKAHCSVMIVRQT